MFGSRDHYKTKFEETKIDLPWRFEKKDNCCSSPALKPVNPKSKYPTEHLRANADRCYELGDRGFSPALSGNSIWQKTEQQTAPAESPQA